jgi:hypothetical protein
MAQCGSTRLPRRGKLTWDQVRAIRAALALGQEPGVVARNHGISMRQLRRIHRMEAWVPTDHAAVAEAGAPPTESHRRQLGARLSIEQYNALWTAYQQDQRLHVVARQCGVGVKTVRRYVEEGDRERSLLPLRERMARMLQRAQVQADYTLAKSRAEDTSLARRIADLIATKLDRADPQALTERELSRILREVQAVKEVALGALNGPAQQTNPFAEWTEAELERFLETGEEPNR